MDLFVGFDSAWTDNLKAPGAICAIEFDRSFQAFHQPILASFGEALDFVRELIPEDGVTLVALDQPTIVHNATSMRPVERVAASLVSWLGGGVQPSNRGRKGMFCDESPIWRFLSELGAMEDPEEARTATQGLHIMEVFPALALATLDAVFFGRLAGPRYNPGRRSTFRIEHWKRVTEAAEAEALSFGCAPVAEWCRNAKGLPAPRKADQDRLDSLLCLLIALRWRLRPRETSMLLGDLTSGYMVLPASDAVRTHLSIAARKHSVEIDGVLPKPQRSASTN